MFAHNDAGAACPRYGSLCALACVALLGSSWVVAAVGPSISGTPPTTVRAGQAFNFLPSTTDPSGGNLSFTISNRPAWAVFSNGTGRLYGTPAAGDVGIYPYVLITAFDGHTRTVLPAFGIEVLTAAGAPPPLVSATLSWIPPTQTSSGGALTNLAGYRIYYGPTPSLGRTTVILNPGVTRFVVSGLNPSTWYFALTAVDGAGNESARTQVETLVME